MVLSSSFFAKGRPQCTVEEIAEEIARRVRPDLFDESFEEIAVLD